MDKNNIKVFLRPALVAERLGIRESSLRKAAQRGQITYLHVGKDIAFAPEAVVEFIKRNTRLAPIERLQRFLNDD